MTDDFEDMEPAQPDPLWVTFDDDGFVVEDDNETVGEHDGPLVGEVKNVRHEVGKNDSRVYEVIHPEYDRPLAFWGSAHINTQYDNSTIGVGTTIGIMQTGEEIATQNGTMVEYDLRFAE
jgi:hypothetical protein